jgi:hypothetical protein
MAQDERHRVYMSFQDRNGGRFQFLEADLKTPLPRRLHFSSADKIIKLWSVAMACPTYPQRGWPGPREG